MKFFIPLFPLTTHKHTLCRYLSFNSYSLQASIERLFAVENTVHLKRRMEKKRRSLSLVCLLCRFQTQMMMISPFSVLNSPTSCCLFLSLPRFHSHILFSSSSSSHSFFCCLNYHYSHSECHYQVFYCRRTYSKLMFERAIPKIPKLIKLANDKGTNGEHCNSSSSIESPANRTISGNKIVLFKRHGIFPVVKFC